MLNHAALPCPANLTSRPLSTYQLPNMHTYSLPRNLTAYVYSWACMLTDAAPSLCTAVDIRIHAAYMASLPRTTPVCTPTITSPERNAWNLVASASLARSERLASNSALSSWACTDLSSYTMSKGRAKVRGNETSDSCKLTNKLHHNAA